MSHKGGTFFPFSRVPFVPHSSFRIRHFRFRSSCPSFQFFFEIAKANYGVCLSEIKKSGDESFFLVYRMWNQSFELPFQQILLNWCFQLAWLEQKAVLTSEQWTLVCGCLKRSFRSGKIIFVPSEGSRVWKPLEFNHFSLFLISNCNLGVRKQIWTYFSPQQRCLCWNVPSALWKASALNRQHECEWDLGLWI